MYKYPWHEMRIHEEMICITYQRYCCTLGRQLTQGIVPVGHNRPGSGAFGGSAGGNEVTKLEAS